MIVFLLMIMMGAPAQSQTGLELTFDKLPSLLQAGNGDVDAAKIQLQAQEQRQGYLRRKFTPTVQLEAGGEEFTTGPYDSLTQPYGSAVVTINVFNGGRDANQNAIIKTQTEIKKIEHQQVVMDRLMHLRELYWEYLYAKEVIQILSSASEMNQKNLSSAMLRIKNGLASNTDQIEFEQNRLQVDQDLQRAQVDMQNYEREIKALVALDESTVLTTTALIPHDHTDDLLKDAFAPEQHRDNRWVQEQKIILEEQKSIDGKWWVPSFDVYAGAAHFTQKERDYLTYSERNDYTLGIKLTMNLFDGGESYNIADSLATQSSAMERLSQQKRRELWAEYQNAKALLELTHHQIHSAEENVKKSEQYYQNTKSEYSRGIKNSPDVLGASQRLINAKVRLLELKKEYQVARAKLMSTLGI